MHYTVPVGHAHLLNECLGHVNIRDLVRSPNVVDLAELQMRFRMYTRDHTKCTGENGVCEMLLYGWSASL